MLPTLCWTVSDLVCQGEPPFPPVASVWCSGHSHTKVMTTPCLWRSHHVTKHLPVRADFTPALLMAALGSRLGNLLCTAVGFEWSSDFTLDHCACHFAIPARTQRNFASGHCLLFGLSHLSWKFSTSLWKLSDDATLALLFKL